MARQSTELANYDAALAAIASRNTATARQVKSSGGKMISTKGGTYKIDGQPVKVVDERGKSKPATDLDFIIIDNILVNAYYEEKWDPDNPSAPPCFAMGRDKDEMEPHKDAEKPQAKFCSECPKNEWGSADTGRGKACKNTIRLGVVTPDAIENGELEKQEPHYLSIPVTSTKNWAGYVDLLADEHDTQPLIAVTNVALESSDKGGFTFEFSFVSKVAAKYYGALVEKYKKVAAVIDFPFAKFEDDSKTAKGKTVTKNPAASARRAGKY